ncbi:MAG: ABC transporter ATP-binding protein [Candidatus Dormibacteraeota bacterium]|nr:ABC transporter ATP-binding protein [Candidatus Dormibacteraeota bacterium]
MLEARALERRFGGVVAVSSVSLTISEGELKGLIGPNGAGKSTLFHLISGHLRPNSGSVNFDGREVTGLAPDARARLGIGIAFQSVRLYRGMSVLENVMVGAHCRTASEFWEAFLRLPRHRREERQILREARAALDRVGLGADADRPADTLPIGRQRGLQVARALCGRPRLLLLDEPAAGLRAAERQQLADLIRDLCREGLAILLVEHDVAFVTGLASRITVMDEGRVIAEGAPAAIRADEAVVAAYLGRPRPAAGNA